jgi:hypothetical protein
MAGWILDRVKTIFGFNSERYIILGRGKLNYKNYSER